LFNWPTFLELADIRSGRQEISFKDCCRKLAWHPTNSTKHWRKHIWDTAETND